MKNPVVQNAIRKGPIWLAAIVGIFSSIVAYARDPSLLKDFPTPRQGLMEYLGLQASRNWFVIAESFPTVNAALKSAGALKDRNKKIHVTVRRWSHQGNPAYSVVLGENLSYKEAVALREKALNSRFPASTYTWTADMPLKISDVCATEEIDGGKWVDNVSKSLEAPVFVNLERTKKGATTFVVNLAFPADRKAFEHAIREKRPIEKLKEAAAYRWEVMKVDLRNSDSYIRYVEMGRRFRVSVKKFDLDNDPDLDLQVCRSR
jgi:hypothetical protein